VSGCFLFARFFHFKRAEAAAADQGGNRYFAAEIPPEIPNLIRRCRYMRVKITLRCNECKQRNYNTMKNKKNTPDKLTMNKYCPFCKKHTVHTETK
jgi:large subunit ribosomal protein L33